MTRSVVRTPRARPCQVMSAAAGDAQLMATQVTNRVSKRRPSHMNARAGAAATMPRRWRVGCFGSFVSWHRHPASSSWSVCLDARRDLAYPMGTMPRAELRGIKCYVELRTARRGPLFCLLWKEGSSIDPSIHHVRLDRTASGLRSSRRSLEAKRKEQHVRQISQSSSVRVCASR